ncbi:MAG: Xaa-Pro dipeptidase [Cellvibrionaceae bacterium]|jgi:Xaa-Pro dipeptidase
MQNFSNPSQVAGRHHAKISALQQPSAETIAYMDELKALNRHVLGPGKIALSEWEKAGLDLPNESAIRRYRLDRVRRELRKHNCMGIVLYDPVNVRYATDSTNMQVWVTHNAARYAFIGAEENGPVIVFEFSHCEHLNLHTEIVTEIRPTLAWFYLISGDRLDEHAKLWAAEVADLVKTHGGGNMRLAIDRCNYEGLMALAGHGVQYYNGESIMELAREIKHPEEIKAMRCAIEACQRSMDIMKSKLVPGVLEQELWGHLHSANIARGGEWIETRILSSGPRTNPWYQECSSREIQNGDLMAFDTDLVGSYGICVDVSRTWLCGDKAPTENQKDVYKRAYEQIQRNTELLMPGTSYRDLTFKTLQYDPAVFNTYTVQYHGVGMCDEAPAIYYPDAWEAYGWDGYLQPGMVICVESYVGHKSGGEGVKLEDQILITETGHEKLNNYPYEELLLR